MLDLCPFCGSGDHVHLTFSGSAYFVECRGCGAMGPVVPDAMDPTCDDAAAIAAWNNALAHTEVKRLRAALEAIAAIKNCPTGTD